MDKSIAHSDIDDYLGSVFPNYISKARSENEIICNFSLDTEKVRASICYQTDNTTDELKYFSLDLKITDNIQEFLMKIEAFNHFKIINKLNIFYELVDEKVDGLSFTFSDDFELQSVMLIDQSFDMNKRIFSSDIDTIINEHQLTEHDMVDILIAQHINLEPEIINDVISLRVPDFDDKKETIVHFLAKFRHHDIKSLYISKNNLIKIAIENFIDSFSNSDVSYTSEVEKFEHITIRLPTRSVSFKFKIIPTYNKITNNFDIRFATLCRTFPTDHSFTYLLETTNNHNINHTIKVLKDNVKKINKPIDNITVYLSSDLSLKEMCLNDCVTLDHNDIESIECRSDIFFIKYFYFHHKEIIDSQNLEFFNATIMSDNLPNWRCVIDDYYKYRDDLLTIIKMSTI